MKAFISVIGDDKIGIIHEVTTVLRKYQINVLDINQTLLQDYFAMVMFVDLAQMSVDFSQLKYELETIGQKIALSIHIQREDLFNAMHSI